MLLQVTLDFRHRESCHGYVCATIPAPGCCLCLWSLRVARNPLSVALMLTKCICSLWKCVPNPASELTVCRVCVEKYGWEKILAVVSMKQSEKKMFETETSSRPS